VFEAADSVAAGDRADRPARSILAQSASRGALRKPAWQLLSIRALRRAAQDMTRQYENCKHPSLAEQRRSGLIEYPRVNK
jgi:hypothetical protein